MIPTALPPKDIDWSKVRTFWACPDFSQVRLDVNAPVSVRAEAEATVEREFARVKVQAGDAKSLWLGEPVKDGVDWLDQRVWYPVRALYENDPPEQQPRPYRLPPLLSEPQGYEDSTVLFQRGLDLMKDGDFAQGLPLYEYRWGTQQGFRMRPPFEWPHWDGKAKGKILIHAEQGAGDCFQFCRFLKHVDFEADFLVFTELFHLMKESGFPVRVIDHLAFEDYAAHLPLCSLPLALGLDMHGRYEPYLKAKGVDNWCGNVRDSVGICWAGSSVHPLNTTRCLTLEDVVNACPPDARLISLQKGPAREQLKYLPPDIHIEDRTDELENWRDTAALVANLDMVVTVDTGVAHLAGALGKPVKLLLAHSTDFRWPKEGDRTPLYPTMRIVRPESLTGRPYEIVGNGQPNRGQVAEVY